MSSTLSPKISQQQIYNFLLPLKDIINIDEFNLQNANKITHELHDYTFQFEKYTEPHIRILNVIEAIRDAIDPVDNASYKILLVPLNKYDWKESKEIRTNHYNEKQFNFNGHVVSRGTNGGTCLATNDIEIYNKIMQDKFIMHNGQPAYEIQKFNGKSRMSIEESRKEFKAQYT